MNLQANEEILKSPIPCFRRRLARTPQGKIMGITGSLSALAFGVTAFITGMIANLGVSLPLYWASLCLVISIVVFFGIKNLIRQGSVMSVNKSDLKFFECLAEMMKKSSEPPSQDITIDTVRHMAKQFSCFVDAPADIPFENRLITTETGRPIRLRYYPHGNKVGPIIIYFPGNAFIHDFFEENHTIISKIAKYASCHAIMVESRLAPEHPYPAPLEDALEATQYIMDHADDFNIDKNKIILAGYSSGANLAAVITNQLRNSNSVKIYHQLLMSGAYDYTNSLHDYDDYVLQDKMLDPASAQFSFDCYSTPLQRKEPTCSPYWEQDLSGLPPTTIMVGEYDGGRSQSEGYAKKLIDAGNKVEKLVLSGQTHGTILYRKICSDGMDSAIVAGNKISNIIKKV